MGYEHVTTCIKVLAC